MKTFFKKYIKSLFIVLFCLFNSGWTSASDLPTLGSHSSCDTDLIKLGINVEEYERYDYSLILLAEVSNKYLVAYFYTPDTRFEFKQIDIEYSFASNESALENAKMQHVRKDLTVLSTSSDGLVSKLLIDLEVPQWSYRKYIINQIVGDSVGGINFDAYSIGHEYIYSTKSDGTIEYNVKSVDYVTITNKKVYHLNIKTDNKHPFGWRFMPSVGSIGERYGFLGFSAEDLDIEKLTSIDVIYDVSAVSYNVPTERTDLVNAYTYDNYNELLDNGGFSKLDYIPKYDDEFAPIIVPYLNDVEVHIEPELITQDQITNDYWDGKKVHDLTWSSIMSFDEIDKYYPRRDSEETLIINEEFKSKFKGMDYIVTIFQADHNKVDSSYLDGKSGFNFSDATTNAKLSPDFADYMMNCSTPAKWGWEDFGQHWKLDFYVYASKEVNNCSITKLTYEDSFKGKHDVKVITSPVNSSGNIYDGSKEGGDDDGLLKAIIILVIVGFIVCILLYFFGPVLVPLIPQILHGLVLGIRFVIVWIFKGIYYIFYYIKVGIEYVIHAIGSIFHR